MKLFNFLTQEIAIDLGTANTIIMHDDRVVVDQPSMVAIDKITDKVIAIGEKAQQMQGKEHRNLEVVKPLKDGVIANFNAAENMIRGMIGMISKPQTIKWSSVFHQVLLR
jgi:rod shape-determining protein MreB